MTAALRSDLFLLGGAVFCGFCLETTDDISLREVFVIAPLVVLVIWIGIHPNTFLEPMEASVRLLLAR